MQFSWIPRLEGPNGLLSIPGPSDALVFPSEPIRYAFEATQGELAAKGIMPGDTLTLPLSP